MEPEERRQPKRAARNKTRARLIEDDAETEYSPSGGSLDRSTESSLHGDDTSVTGELM